MLTAAAAAVKNKNIARVKHSNIKKMCKSGISVRSFFFLVVVRIIVSSFREEFPLLII